MHEHPADIELEQSPSPSSEPEAPQSRTQLPVVFLVGAGVLLFALTAAYVFLWRTPPETQAPAAAAKPAPVTAPKVEQINLPPLDESDPIVRQLVQKLSSNPVVAAWLTTDGLLLNFVMVTSRIATGITPVAELKSVGPIPPFRTRTAGENRIIDPASYRRYDRHAQAVDAVDARGAAQLYNTLKPRIADAYGRVGPRDGNFDPVLERAIVELLRVPVVEGEVALQPHATVFEFEDPKLQELSASQKQLLRMGPQNVRIVQAKLREIAAALGIPESRLPPPR